MRARQPPDRRIRDDSLRAPERQVEGGISAEKHRVRRPAPTHSPARRLTASCKQESADLHHDTCGAAYDQCDSDRHRDRIERLPAPDRLEHHRDGRYARHVKRAKPEERQKLRGVQVLAHVDCTQHLKNHEHRQFLAQDAKKQRNAQHHRQSEPPRRDWRQRDIDRLVGTDVVQDCQYHAPPTRSGVTMVRTSRVRNHVSTSADFMSGSV